jgi:CxxC motif-containing protein (DUF1111 family)
MRRIAVRHSTWERASRWSAVLAIGAAPFVELACGNPVEAPRTPLSGGAATVFDETHDAFSLPAPILSEEHHRSFFVGNSYFNQNWVSAPSSVETRDGLGPLFNARSCSTCHFKDGRGRPPEAGGAMVSELVRISVAGRGPHGEPVPDPVYGDQLQGGALPQVPAEAEVHVDYDGVAGAFADGERYELRKPHLRLEHLGYGAMSSAVLMSARVAPAMIGLGLLEAVPESALRNLADPDDRNHDGISGRLNIVWDAVHNAKAVGRFGWKAEQPTVLQQSAGAFLGDMGLTSWIFPHENHTERQHECDALPNGGSPEVGEDILRHVALYARSLGVPARRHPLDAPVAHGGELFMKAGCALCHVPTLHTEALADMPEVAGLEIHAYSDLLLHDMGDGLSDERPTFEAEGREWRTPPLWGIGLVRRVNQHTLLLHDGRARDAGEAVLWHDGEGRAAREAFAGMSHDDRQALLAFLESL